VGEKPKPGGQNKKEKKVSPGAPNLLNNGERSRPTKNAQQAGKGSGKKKGGKNTVLSTKKKAFCAHTFLAKNKGLCGEREQNKGGEKKKKGEDTRKTPPTQTQKGGGAFWKTKGGGAKKKKKKKNNKGKTPPGQIQRKQVFSQRPKGGGGGGRRIKKAKRGGGDNVNKKGFRFRTTSQLKKTPP